MAEDFLGELGKSISKATQQAVDKTGVFIESTKIAAQITEEKKEIDRLYQRIGEIVYRLVSSGQMSANDEIAPIIDDVAAHSAQVKLFKKNLADVKNMKICESCGAVINMDAAFCPHCGAPVTLTEQPEE